MSALFFPQRFDARRNGNSWQAKCPSHDDREPSLSIKEGEDRRTLHCHAGCPIDNAHAASGMTRRDLFVPTFRNGQRIMTSGRNGNGNDSEPTPQISSFDWEACVAAFTQKHSDRLSEWRGYSPEFCSSLYSQKLVGVHEGCLALPVHDRAGNSWVRIVGRRMVGRGFTHERASAQRHLS